MLYFNMCCRITIGNVRFDSCSSFTIDENILEISNSAKIVIPRLWKSLKNGFILDHIKVGNKVLIESGYNDQLTTQFIGYVSEIEDSTPLVIHCDDEMYLLKRNNVVKSYKNVTLKEVLSDIIPKEINIECPDMRIGKYVIDNITSYNVLQSLSKDFGLYSRLIDSTLKVGLAYEYGNNTKRHVYVLSQDPRVIKNGIIKVNTKDSALKYRRKEDVKIRYKAIANNPNGKKVVVEIGDKGGDVSVRTLNFPGPLTETELRERATGILSKVRYDGYTGTVTGFGLPQTRAGDSLTIRDFLHQDRQGTYLIEQVSVTYDESNGFQRENTLGCLILK